MANTKLAVDFNESRIDAIFSDLDQCHLPGACVGIAIGGRPIYRRGFGLANIELPIALSPTIRMRIASVTKHFTALAYLLLCEEGKAEIDDRIQKVLPELHPVTHGVTFRQLMGNISGLRDVRDICAVFSGFGCNVSSAELLGLYRDIPDAHFAPGTNWFYNNGGWIIVTAAIERIAGESLEDVLRTRIFEPAGMSQTLLRRNDRGFIPNSAAPHMMNSRGAYVMSDSASAFTTDMAGEGGVVSTIDDMLRWLAHMDEPRIGSEATWHALKAPLELTNGTSTAYGLGLVRGKYRGVETIYHPGGGTGINAQMLKVPAAQLDVVAMSNRHDVSSVVLVNKILDACLPELDPVPAAFSLPVGQAVFRSPTTGRVIQLGGRPSVPWTEEGQQIVLVDGMEMHAEVTRAGTARLVGVFEVNQTIEFEGDPSRPTTLVFSDFGNSDELVPLVPVDERRVANIVGGYRSETAKVDVTITGSSASAILRTYGHFGSAEYPLSCLAAGLWRASHESIVYHGGLLSFDDRGRGFEFSNGQGTRSLPFRRLQ